MYHIFTRHGKVYTISLVVLLSMTMAMTMGCGSNSSEDSAVYEVTDDNVDAQSTNTGSDEEKSLPESETPADSQAPEISVSDEEEKGTPISRFDFLEAIYEYNGNPELDFGGIQNLERIPITDMDEDSELTKWYAYALGCRGAEENPDDSYTFFPDKDADRYFAAQILLSDFTNRGFGFDKVDQSIVPYDDLLEISDNEFYRRNVTFLCESGIINKSDRADTFDLHGEYTDVDLANTLKNYDEFLKQYDLDGSISMCLGSNMTIGTSLRIKGAQTDNASEQIAENNDTEITGSDEVQNVTALTDKFKAAGFNYTPINKSVDYTSECYRTDDRANANIEFMNYKRDALDDEYDQLSVTIQLTISDPLAEKNNFYPYYGVEDSYNYEDGQTLVGDICNNNVNYQEYSLMYNGISYDKCSARAKINKAKWIDGCSKPTIDFTIIVPKGYDGMFVWIACYPGDGHEDYGLVHLGELETFYAFKCD